jgi:glycine/D-amino acid oxidase-like deaminating enzyme
MGAGIFGLSIAYACARRGARLRIIDRRGVAAGSSGGTVGALAPHTPENWNPKKQFQLESLLMAQAFWADVETISGLPTGYGRVGRLQSIDTPRGLELALARQDSARDLWHSAASWTVVAPVGPWAPTSATSKLVHDTLSARLDPVRACQSLSGAIQALGGEVVTGHDTPDDTSGGRVVWATGYEGLQDLSDKLDKTAGNGVKGQSLTLQYEAGGAPQLYAEGLHIVPHDNGTVGIGSTSERDFGAPDTTDAQLDALHERALRICPVLAGAPVITRWAGVRPRARSRAPMLGPWPNRPGHYIANGGFNIGFGMAPKVAEVMADLVLEGRDAIPDGFRVADNLR